MGRQTIIGTVRTLDRDQKSGTIKNGTESAEFKYSTYTSKEQMIFRAFQSDTQIAMLIENGYVSAVYVTVSSYGDT